MLPLLHLAGWWGSDKLTVETLIIFQCEAESLTQTRVYNLVVFVQVSLDISDCRDCHI